MIDRRRGVVLLVYLALLGASHLARMARPEEGPRPGQRSLVVAGWPEARDGVRIAWREWEPGNEGADRSPTAPGPPAAPGPTPGGIGHRPLNRDTALALPEPAAPTPPAESGGNAGQRSEPVLLLHGSPGSGSAFRGLGALLGNERRAIAPDLPGFGGSSPRVRDYSIRAHARMTLQLLDSLEVERAHLVGFSMGGGVALELYRAAPDRIASITLLSAIGVQEHELLGEYHLNHAIHGLQLLCVRFLRDLVPHFGALDDAFPGLSYARNFFDTDQRPLRGVLRGQPGPMLIVQGTRDPLVPPAAAREHHRIVPQAELVMLDGDHFMTFREPERIEAPIASFLERVETGAATLRATADAARIRAAEPPFTHFPTPPVTGFALALALALIVLATFVSEDLALIGAGLLIARGSLPWAPGLGAAFAGIVAGDLLLYLGARLVGRPFATLPPFRWLIRPRQLVRTLRWVRGRGATLILASRFVPGTRLPTCVAAGIARMPLPLFALWILVAAALWTPLLVGASALFGSALAEHFESFRGRTISWLIVCALLTLLAVRLGIALLDRQGRLRLLARAGRLRRWEFWPAWIIQLPVVAWVLLLGLRHRSFTVFTAANPSFPDGGFVGESKSEILAMIGARERVARTVAVEPGEEVDAGALAARVGGLPVVVKPDVGERGAGVEIARTLAALEKRLAEAAGRTLVQEHVAGEELGVFHIRLPGEAQGQIFGITEKRQPVVAGDGKRTLGELVLADRRLRCQRRVFARQLGVALDRIPESGEPVILEERGNHCHGCEFRDGSRLETPALAEAIDRISRTVPGFHFGRYDIRGDTMEEIRAGRFLVIELNGVSSEATHIYDPSNSLLAAWRTLFRQWELAFRIGAANRRLGARPARLFPFLARVAGHLRRPSPDRPWTAPAGHSGAAASAPDRKTLDNRGRGT